MAIRITEQHCGKTHGIGDAATLHMSTTKNYTVKQAINNSYEITNNITKVIHSSHFNRNEANIIARDLNAAALEVPAILQKF